MAKSINIIGDQYGKLTVLSEYSNINYKRIYTCKCSCGNIKNIRLSHLRSGHTVSCGCKQIQNLDQTTHGMSKTKLYKRYQEMIRRCYKTTHHKYPRYGGRGISVCDAWKNDFINFYNWAIKTGYSDKFTIDRKNNNGNYEPNNCRWATASIQIINQGKSCRNTSGYKYIHWNKSKEQWIVRVTVNKKRIEIGSFTHIEIAKKALIHYLTINNLYEQLKSFNYE